MQTIIHTYQLTHIHTHIYKHRLPWTDLVNDFDFIFSPQKENIAWFTLMNAYYKHFSSTLFMNHSQKWPNHWHIEFTKSYRTMFADYMMSTEFVNKYFIQPKQEKNSCCFRFGMISARSWHLLFFFQILFGSNWKVNLFWLKNSKNPM